MEEFKVEYIVAHQLYTRAQKRKETGRQFCTMKECESKLRCTHPFSPVNLEKLAKAHCKYIYLCHWEGYPVEERTWEPECNLWKDGIMALPLYRYKHQNPGFSPNCELLWRERAWSEVPRAILPPAERAGKKMRDYLQQIDREMIEQEDESSYEDTDSECEGGGGGGVVQEVDDEERKRQVAAAEKKRLDGQDNLEAMERQLSREKKEQKRASGGCDKVKDEKQETKEKKPELTMEDVFGEEESREKRRQQRKEQRKRKKEREELERRQREKEERQRREGMTEEERRKDREQEKERERLRREREKAREKEREKERSLRRRAEQRRRERDAEKQHVLTESSVPDVFAEMEAARVERERLERERRKEKIRQMKEKELKRKEDKPAVKPEDTVDPLTTGENGMDMDMTRAPSAAVAMETVSDGEEEEMRVRLHRMCIDEPRRDLFLYESLRNARRWNSSETLCLFWHEPLKKERAMRLSSYIARRAVRCMRAVVEPNKNNHVVHFKKAVKNGKRVMRAVRRDRPILERHNMRTTISFSEIMNDEFVRRVHAFGQRIGEMQACSSGEGETRNLSHSLAVWFIAGHWDFAATFLSIVEPRRQQRTAVLKVLLEMFAADAGYGWVFERDEEKRRRKERKPYACTEQHRKCRTLANVLSCVPADSRFSDGGVLPVNAAQLAIHAGAGTCVLLALIRAGCPLSGVSSTGLSLAHTVVSKCSSRDLRRVLRAGVCMHSLLEAGGSRLRVVDWARNKAKQTGNEDKARRIRKNVKLVRELVLRVDLAWTRGAESVFPSFYTITAQIGKARTLRVGDGSGEVEYTELLGIPQSAADDYLKKEKYSTVCLVVFAVDIRGGARVHPRKREADTVYTPFRVVHTQPNRDEWNGMVKASMQWPGVDRFPLVLRPCKRPGVWIAELPRRQQKMLLSVGDRVSVYLRAHLPPGQLVLSNLCISRTQQVQPIVTEDTP